MKTGTALVGRASSERLRWATPFRGNVSPPEHNGVVAKEPESGVDYDDLVHPCPELRGPERFVARVRRRWKFHVRPYEVMVIFDAGQEEGAITATVDRATELIRSRGGSAGKVDRWGRRRFAYELKHRTEGYYLIIEATAEPSVMAELDRTLFLADEVLRHKITRLPDSPAAVPAGSAVTTGAVAETPSNGA